MRAKLGPVIAKLPMTTAETMQSAMRCHQAGQLADAERLYRQVLTAEPRHAAALHLLGLIAHQCGQHEAAIHLMTEAMAIDASQAMYHGNLGEAYRLSKQPAAAEACYRQALAIDRGFEPAHYNWGLLLQTAGQWPSAQEHFEQAVRLQPAHAEAQNQLGNVLRAQSKPAAAAVAYQAALRAQPNYAEALGNLGATMVDLERADEAIALLEQALSLPGDSAPTYFNLGNACRGKGDTARAIDCFRKALALRPDFVEANCNLGTLEQERGNIEQAMACFQAALAVRPDLPEACSRVGMIHQEQGRLAEAAVCFKEVLARRPDFGTAHYQLGMIYLVQGDFARGWQECEWRWKTKIAPRPFPQPAWNGGSLTGKTVLVHPEQGFGDTLQFVRYVPLLEQMAAEVILEVQPPLVPLMRHSGMRNVIAYESPLPDFDLHVLLMSLPRIFETRLDTIPADVPYLSADPQLVELWRERLAGIDGFRVGINWQGDRGYSLDVARSIPLVEFAPLARVPGVALISLQQKQGLEQLPAAREQFTIHDFGESVDTVRGAFMDTAAIMKSLDLVITSDTSTAHLAGGLGANVWLALPRHAEWRWLLDRQDSPWYPTMRLFRQERSHDWPGVFEQMALQLPHEIRRLREN